MKVSIIDYDMGNIASLMNALRYLGVNASFSDSYSDLDGSDFLILPGVGSYHQAILNLHKRDLVGIIRRLTREKKIPILGICLGFQIMTERGSEGGDIEGLNLIPSRTKRFKSSAILKVPHVGYDRVFFDPNDPWTLGLGEGLDFYFTHSYYVEPITSSDYGFCHTCQYGASYLASYHFDNVYGCQFHPEKSQSNGLLLLKKFLML